MSKRLSIMRHPVILLLVAALCIPPFFLSDYHLTLLAKFIVFGLFAMSVNLVWGYAGIVSFGHAIFFGGGSYVLGITLRYIPYAEATWLAMVLAIAVPALVGAAISYFLFYGRVSGVFFGIVTLALTGVIQSLVIVSSDITGGLNGLYNFVFPRLVIPGLFDIDLMRPQAAYFLVLVATVAAVLLVRHLIGSRLGDAIKALGENEERAEFLGYNVPFIKVVVFSISCGIAGLAGALYVPLGFISPDLLGMERSASVLVWVAVGGRGTLAGPFIGALVVNYLQTFLSDKFVTIWLLFIGILSVVVVLAWPSGIAGLFRTPLARRIAARLGFSER